MYVQWNLSIVVSAWGSYSCLLEPNIITMCAALPLSAATCLKQRGLETHFKQVPSTLTQHSPSIGSTVSVSSPDSHIQSLYTRVTSQRTNYTHSTLSRGVTLVRTLARVTHSSPSQSAGVLPEGDVRGFTRHQTTQPLC